MQDFRNLKVWRRAHELALWTYRITAEFPNEELFGLRLSMRKAAIDIPALIAEGCGKSNDLEFSRSLSAAVAMGHRLEYYALMARDLNFLSAEVQGPYEAEVIEIKKILNSFNSRLRHE
ncbi:MAG: four helix bundle protein [Chloracidobacterium sp.]|nr:four helix bundle protein [Chloracidobacterium sp.]